MGRFNIKDEKDFEKCKASAESFYDGIIEVYCPYFKEKIAFNAKGIRHLKFKSDRQARPIEDQYARLKLIHFAPEILIKSSTLQGISETRQFEAQKTNSRWEHVLKDVTYFEFIAVVNKLRIKIIIKQVLGAEKHFWSIVPFWKIDKINSKRILHSGNLAHD
jgi:hypothetical protein